MLTGEIQAILSNAMDVGWVLEPEAKRLFSLSGLDVPQFIWTKDAGQAISFAGKVGYPVVAKIVSPEIIHKSDVSGVIMGIEDGEELAEAIKRLSTIQGYAGILVEKQQKGIELIIGVKIDSQFGSVILFGIGGTEAEIYQDVALRMAPLREKDVGSMLKEIKAHQLLEGYRGSEPVNIGVLTAMLIRFSQLIVDLENSIESIDLNPVICSSARCIIADARIMLKK